MKAFERVEQLHDDYLLTLAGVREASSNLQFLKNAIRERIETDRTNTLLKINRLEAQAADTSRPESVRRLAAAELEKLKEMTFAPTEAEKQAFLSEIENMEAGRVDLVNLSGSMRESLKAAETELATMRAATLGDSTLSLLPNWISGEERFFENLCQEVDFDGK